MNKILEIKCNICGVKNGELELTDTAIRNGNWDISLSDAELLQKTGVADSRCESCESLYGNFSQMVEEVRKVTKDGNLAEQFVKEHRKIAFVVDNLFKGENLDKALMVQFNNPLFKKKKEELEK